MDRSLSHIHSGARAFRHHALAAAAVALLSAGAQAQEAAAPADKSDGLKLDAVVVTGTSTAKSKMRSSVAISTIESEGVTAVTAASATDVLRAVPGIRAEASGGESNANVAVRGIPVSAGGARYIQFQEDGLPVLQFGDIAFATPDTWMRADAAFERLEVVRGGSASTLATGAPGGIINFISKTGIEQGGSIQLTKGLDFDQTRVDYGYGGRLAPKTRFFIGGFYRVGDGGRKGADGAESGGQIRGNVTFELSGKDYVRFSFKHLDDHTPTFMPTPVRYVNGSIQEIPGLDPRRTAFYNAGWPLDNTLTNTNGRALSNIRDGLSAKSDAFGADVSLDAGGASACRTSSAGARTAAASSASSRVTTSLPRRPAPPSPRVRTPARSTPATSSPRSCSTPRSMMPGCWPTT